MRLLIESCRDEEHFLARFHALERGGQGAFGSAPHPPECNFADTGETFEKRGVQSFGSVLVTPLVNRLRRCSGCH
jgi:hypothetical protein